MKKHRRFRFLRGFVISDLTGREVILLKTALSRYREEQGSGEAERMLSREVEQLRSRIENQTHDQKL